MELEDVSIIAWIQKNRLKTTSGTPFDLRSHLFWFDILTDDHPKQVWLKAPQVGGTEVALIKAAYKSHKRSMNVIYTMPTQEDSRLLVKGKLNPLIANNVFLQKIFADTDTLDFKRVGTSNFYFKGTMTNRAALSIPADWVINDEEDRGDQVITDQYTSRMEHSHFQWELHFSNPSFQGHGVSKYWNRSDKRHWFVTCPHCQKKQYLSWPESIDVAMAAYVCKHCHGVLSDEDRRVGSWHPMKTDYVPEYRGYWISLLMCPWVPASRIIDRFKNKDEEYFYNFVLGLPYVGKGNKVEEDTIFKNLTDRTNPQDGPIVIGVDTGTTIWLTCLNKRGLFHWGKANDYDEIEDLLKRWPQAIAVFDQGGDLIKPRELQEKYPGRIFLCYYQEDRKTLQMIRWGDKDEYGAVTVDRNRMIQLIVDEFTDKRVPIFGSRSDWQEFYTHFANIYRQTEESALGVPVKRWKRSGPDHLVHAYLYARVGMDKFLGGEAGVVMPFDPLDDMETGVMANPDGTSKILLREKDDYDDGDA